MPGVAAEQGSGFPPYRRLTKRDGFLATMEQIVPWQVLCAAIEPHYPSLAKDAGRWGSNGCCACASSSIGSIKPMTPSRNRSQSTMRARVEHGFAPVKSPQVTLPRKRPRVSGRQGPTKAQGFGQVFGLDAC